MCSCSRDLSRGPCGVIGAREAGDGSPSSKARRRMTALGLEVRLVRARTTLNPFPDLRAQNHLFALEEAGERRRPVMKWVRGRCVCVCAMCGRE